MDSAFKRRWDWEYIPINYEETEENPSSKFKIKLSENQYFSWLEFIKIVNEIIKSNPNLGMDKCIGNYFIKTESNEIDLNIFINKVIFYLWNDVFKDESSDESIFPENTFYEDFFPIATQGKEKIIHMITDLGIEIKTEDTPTE